MIPTARHFLEIHVLNVSKDISTILEIPCVDKLTLYASNPTLSTGFVQLATLAMN